MPTVNIVKGDTWPPLQMGLADAEGGPSPLGATITFFMRPQQGGVPAITGPAVVVDAGDDELVVEYAWKPGDTDVPGVYVGEFKMVWNGNTPSPQRETFPSDDPLFVVIRGGAS